jgi:hypothetical protein
MLILNNILNHIQLLQDLRSPEYFNVLGTEYLIVLGTEYLIVLGTEYLTPESLNVLGTESDTRDIVMPSPTPLSISFNTWVPRHLALLCKECESVSWDGIASHVLSLTLSTPTHSVG